MPIRHSGFSSWLMMLFGGNLFMVYYKSQQKQKDFMQNVGTISKLENLFLMIPGSQRGRFLSAPFLKPALKQGDKFIFLPVYKSVQQLPEDDIHLTLTACQQTALLFENWTLFIQILP
ncbi:hypothetical protein XENOCAPTIV_013847 [Xenoophorus captivus]|uniref:Uncharacterized protein n=1 Tax=Xenoophorus captivus TaxID=1517983 RepID=A0ABV0RMJ7_9TELE